MNQFLKKIIFFFALVISVNLYAQDDVFAETKEKPFNPKFTLGSGLYTLNGDIQNDNSGFLKGIAGFNAGMKFDIANKYDLSLLFIKNSFAANNGDESFTSDVDGFGLHLGYIFMQSKKSKIDPFLSLGVQQLGTTTIVNDKKQERSSVIAIPLAVGLRMNIIDRLEFDIFISEALGLGDIDMSKQNEGNADGYMSLNFSIHYDLFTPGKNKEDYYYDETYYNDVDFAKLESEDEDGDLVPDMDDYCPQTPIGVKVDKNGCPLDDDKDGIANFLDKQKNTPEGSIVDENGVRLTAEKYHSMYSDDEAASRKYANFYNESEIKRENYKTVDEYLIAKANAFNKAYNQDLNDNVEVLGLRYKVQIGEYKEVIPAKIINKLLSFDDLESFAMSDDAVVYAVGTYSTLNDALNRQYSLEEKGFEDTDILVDNNGEISAYVAPKPKSEIDEDEEVQAPEDIVEMEGGVVNQVTEPIDETTYRIQIGAFNKALSDEVFEGVSNVISFVGKDGLIRYMAGSFEDYKNAVDYQVQMKSRGFEDAFIVTYKNGERISLNIAIKSKKSVKDIKGDSTQVKIDKAINLAFTVQILVGERSVSQDELKRMGSLGNIDKEAEGSDMYRYFAGTFKTLEEANVQLEKAKLAGYSDAFIFAIKDGERITLEEARKLLK
tara:strand:+ start:16299 stop:18287 length:1989 start_codon:yes stop_codon:yes gene_type:complete